MPDRSAVLVIDLANDFVFPPGTIATAGGEDYQRRAQSIIPALGRLLDGARAAGVPVIYATDAHQEGDSELRKWPPHAMKGTREAAIVDDLRPHPGDIVLEKSTVQSVPQHGSQERLRRLGVSRLYITGLHTDCCARHTSADAFQKGFDLVWVTDALQAFTNEAHLAGLEYFKAWYATDPQRQFQTVDDVIAHWAPVGATVR